MQKANAGAGGNVMAVSVVSFGNDPLAVSLPIGATVRDALNSAGISVGSQEFFVSGEKAEMGDILEAGDVLSVVSPKQAGTR